MSLETTESQMPLQPATPGQDDQAVSAGAPRRRINPFVFGMIVLVLLAAGAGWYIYSSHFEDTDDAQVDGHLNPIAARIDGTIMAVHADDNQAVHAGDLLVELDPGDDKIALQQTRAQYDQAVSMLRAAHPNLPITRTNNRTDLASQQAEVNGSEAALGAARHDLDSAVARLKESQALNERNQADFAEVVFHRQVDRGVLVRPQVGVPA